MGRSCQDEGYKPSLPVDSHRDCVETKNVVKGQSMHEIGIPSNNNARGPSCSWSHCGGGVESHTATSVAPVTFVIKSIHPVLDTSTLPLCLTLPLQTRIVPAS